MLASVQEKYSYHENVVRDLADGWADLRYGRTAVSGISSHRNGEYRSFMLFFKHSLSFTSKWNGFRPISNDLQYCRKPPAHREVCEIHPSRLGVNDD